MPARLDRLFLAIGLIFCGRGSAVAAMRHHFDLPAGTMAASIARIGALTGDSIAAFDPNFLESRAPAVRLDGSTGDALAAILGPNARALRVGSHAWRIVPRSPPKRCGPAPSPDAVTAAIIVTGTKRAVPLSRYPASIALIDGAQIEHFGATPDTAALSRQEPALQSTNLGPGRNKLFLRGIADSSFNGAGVALVGLYLDDLRLTYNAPDPDLRLFDVDRIEILDGPQGTLYGAGSLAGLVRIHPKAPDLDRAEGALWLGGTSLAHGSAGGDGGGIVNIPLVAGVAALRIVAYAAQDGGYIDDRGQGASNVNRTRTAGGRAALRIALGGGWAIDAAGIAQNIRNRDAQYADRALAALTHDSIAAQPSYNLFRAGNIALAGPLGSARLTSTTGLVHQSLGQIFLPDDGNGGDVYRQVDHSRQITEELRLSSGSTSPLQWVVGASGLWGRVLETRTIAFGGFDRSLGRADTTTADLTLFGEMTVRLSTRLSLTAGGRLSRVRLGGIAVGARAKEGDADKVGEGSHPLFNAVRHEHFAAPTVALGWTPGAGELLFLRFSEGYRPGGQTASGIIQRYDADRLHTVEIGFRLSPATMPVSAELSGMIGRWTNVQADVLDATGLPVTRNVGNGIVRSLDARLRWRIAGPIEARFATTIAGGHVHGLDAVTGTVIRTPLPDVARDAVTASLGYRHALGAGLLDAEIRANHVGHSVLGSGSELSRLRQGGYWMLSSGADWRAGLTTWSLFVDNLLDSAANSFAFGNPTVLYDDRYTTPLRPRSIRLGVRRNF
jgi:outer membrane receptor protein involved in Fe transport